MQTLRDFIGVLDQQKLRVRRPSRFIFFCGGVLAPKSSKSPSLRDFLLKKLEKKGSQIDGAKLICAEDANTLFKDSNYRSLIEFESDIADIADLVLLIGESAGSLAELENTDRLWTLCFLLLACRAHAQALKPHSNVVYFLGAMCSRKVRRQPDVG